MNDIITRKSVHVQLNQLLKSTTYSVLDFRLTIEDEQDLPHGTGENRAGFASGDLKGLRLPLTLARRPSSHSTRPPRQLLLLEAFDSQGNAVSTAEAKRRNSSAQVSLLQRV